MPLAEIVQGLVASLSGARGGGGSNKSDAPRVRERVRSGQMEHLWQK
jgi:hypothetical protein